MCFARLVTHYWSHAAWLEDGSLIRDAGRLAGIPGVLVNGRLDVSGPPDIAWRLSQAWPDASLHLVDDAGHGLRHPDVTALVVGATDRFGKR
jgi:proline iminopeptidase